MIESLCDQVELNQKLSSIYLRSNQDQNEHKIALIDSCQKFRKLQIKKLLVIFKISILKALKRHSFIKKSEDK